MKSKKEISWHLAHYGARNGACRFVVKTAGGKKQLFYIEVSGIIITELNLNKSVGR